MCLAKSCVLSVCILTGLTFSGQVAGQERIAWLTDLGQARKLAEQQQRVVLLHFWSESCVPCRELEQNVFNQPELIRVISTNFIPVKINVIQEPRFADYYHIESVPTDVLVHPSGRELYRRISPANSNEYIAMLDQVRSHSATMGARATEVLAQEFSRAQLPPRGDLPADQPRSEPINTDPRTVMTNDGNAPRATLAQTVAGPTSSVVRNEMATPGGATAPAQPVGVTAGPRYGNPFIQQNAAPAAGPVAVAPTQPAAAQPAPPAQAAPGRAWEPASGSGPSTSPPAIGTQPTSPPNVSGTPTQPSLNSQTPAPRPSAAPPTPVTLPANSPPLAMDGYCPVSLVALTKWVKGDPRWGVQHRGRTYLLASQADQQRFFAEPDRFSPALSGYDPVRFAETRQLVDGRREYGVFYANTYYLFSDEAALLKFEGQPQGYVQVVRQAMASSASNQPQR